MRLADLSAKARRAWVSTSADAVLTGAKGVMSTPALAELLALILKDKDPGDFALIASTLTAIARDGHPAAKQDGEEFAKYGKTFKRWTWGLARHRRAAVVEDVDEWTIPGKPATPDGERWAAIAAGLGLTIAEAKATLKGAIPDA